ncbi:AAEL015045-PA [Aedes aegypti]|uniref:AAEL015045-PA n=1 Tax=Aedes aegypti TaxID=7159 RepID=Q16ES1_AEDAE|nr:AAEL015045-PA [Aedes aegypti]
MFVPSEDPVKSEFLSEEEDDEPEAAPKRKRMKRGSKKSTQKAIQYNCDQCPEVFQDQLLMVAHRRGHAGLTPFYCETCEREFPTLLETKLHYAEQHTQQKTWDCDHPDCTEQFASHQALRQHKIKVHDPNYTKPQPRVSICEACGDSFDNSQKLRRHRYAVHETEEKPYMCEICFLRFSLPHKLKKHMLRHENIRSHVCPYCGVAKVTKGELVSHIKNVHSKERGLSDQVACDGQHADIAAATSAEEITFLKEKPKKDTDRIRNVRKINRNNGKAYVRKDNVLVEGKSFQERFDCGCPKNCKGNFASEAILEQFFGSFWNLGDWHKQNALVADQVKGVDVNRHRPRSELNPRSERTLQFQYFIPSEQDNVRVCQKYFLGILQISAGRLYKCLGRKSPNKKRK